ncbi:MAG: hypothetical protein LBT47_08230 [Deltaproteobacteria bacterium]|nr:hypothetical protein [Deltaproteobacteria bacterium]
MELLAYTLEAFSKSAAECGFDAQKPTVFSAALRPSPSLFPKRRSKVSALDLMLRQPLKTA